MITAFTHYEPSQFVGASRALKVLRLSKLLSFLRLLRVTRLVRYLSQYEVVSSCRNMCSCLEPHIHLRIWAEERTYICMTQFIKRRLTEKKFWHANPLERICIKDNQTGLWTECALLRGSLLHKATFPFPWIRCVVEYYVDQRILWSSNLTEYLPGKLLMQYLLMKNLILVPFFIPQLLAF